MSISKKIKLLLSSPLLASPLLALACVPTDSKKLVEANTLNATNTVSTRRNGNDFGIAVPSISSLNYIKSASANKILPSLVEGLTKSAPAANTAIGNILKLPTISFEIYSGGNGETVGTKLLENKNSIKSQSRTYTVSNFGVTTGVLAPSTNENPSFIGVLNSENKYVSLLSHLNKGASKWSNGDKVKAQDFIDTLLYILDTNTASSRLNELLTMSIKNVNAMKEIQNDYLKKFGKIYSNPFGRRRFVKTEDGQVIEDHSQHVYQSENKGDEEVVNKMKQIASGIGLYTGRIFNEFSNQQIRDIIKNNASLNPSFSVNSSQISYLKDGQEITKTLTKNPFLDPLQVFEGPELTPKYKAFAADEYDLRIQFEDSAPKSFVDVYYRVISSPILLPVNRKFVEYTLKNKDDLGSDLSKFLWNGPFDIKELKLGSQGNMTLTKRKSYYSVEKTVPNQVKVYFADQPETLSNLFSDGYIAFTQISPAFQKKFWSQLSARKYMRKSQGYGTIALQFNLDNSKRGNSYLQDPDLRKAIYYAIDREAMLKLAQLDSSFGVTTWTAFGQAKSERGINLETFFDTQKFKSEYVENGQEKEFPLQSLEFVDHLAKSYNFENLSRKDPSYDVATANFYLDRFKRKYPKLKEVKLEFIYTSGPQTGIAIGIQDLINRAFNKFINIDIVALPENIYKQRIISGDFDLTTQNFDTFGSTAQGYITAFFTPDEINPVENKLNGLVYNPASSFTYQNWWNSMDEEKQKEVVQRLGIKGKFLSKFKELITRKMKLDPKTKKPIMTQVVSKINGKDIEYAKDMNGNDILVPVFEESTTDYSARINSFFNGVFTPKEIHEKWNSLEVFKLIAVFEKILRESAPVVPLMEVDTYWTISRLRGVGNTFTFALQFAFDINNNQYGLPVEDA
ncbi:ABC transporter substrate-binding protein [Mycoplasma sp. 1654_15]|uniref:ABC transporter substrate-binding protein n=1 Tax=Mycoplasma sp. 1654_15 TaxID=2725994 RepID=UPI001448D245|nr:ABC transporter substrate-binding protein [Mycoplasma sp. 1654_15]QJB71251.1 oligopeptide ABC transporter substrate-binding protein OppA [Mycoplasma sp. 1654_15]